MQADSRCTVQVASQGGVSLLLQSSAGAMEFIPLALRFLLAGVYAASSDPRLSSGGCPRFSGFQVLLSGVIAGSDSEPDGALRSLSTVSVRLSWLRPAVCSVWPAIREIFLAGFVWEGILSCDGATGRDVDVLGILRRAAEPE